MHHLEMEKFRQALKIALVVLSLAQRTVALVSQKMVSINPCFLDTQTSSQIVHIFAVCFYIAATVFSFLLNVFLVIVLVKGWKTRFSSDHFYRQVLEICIASFLYLISYMVVVIPYTILEKPYLPQPGLIFMSSLRVCGFYLGIYLSFEIAIDRALLFYSPLIHSDWTKHERVRTCMIWFCAVVTATVPTSFGCYERFNPIGHYFTLKCSVCEITHGFSFIGVFLAIGTGVSLATIFSYVLLILKIRRMMALTTTPTRRTATEIDLVFQFGFICTFHMVSTFFFLPTFMPSNSWGILATNFVMLMNSITNPVVLLLFNTKVKKGCRSLLRHESVVTTFQTTQPRSPQPEQKIYHN